MRVTNKQMADNAMAGLFRESEKLLYAQEKVTTQKRINRPSDDPVGAGQVLRYRQALAGIAQYQQNSLIGENRINLVETTLEAAQAQVDMASKLASENANNLGNADARAIAALQVEQIRSQVLQLANTRSGANHLFAGRLSDTAPFVLDSLTDTISYVGDNSPDADFRLLASENVEVRIPSNGAEIFTGAEDLFDALRLLKDELRQVNPDIAVINAQAARLQVASDQLEAIRAEGASLFSRVKLARTQLDQLERSFSEMLAGTEDADMARAIVELKAQENAYQTTIATAARLIQPSLIDFLE